VRLASPCLLLLLYFSRRFTLAGFLRAPFTHTHARASGDSFVQYPFDKTKMTEVTEYVAASGLGAKIRSKPGVKDLEVSFCPGEGWLAARYIFNDLDDMVAFLGSAGTDPDLIKFKEVLMSSPHYDSSRTPHEFKGFFKPEL